MNPSPTRRSGATASPKNSPAAIPSPRAQRSRANTRRSPDAGRPAPDLPDSASVVISPHRDGPLELEDERAREATEIQLGGADWQNRDRRAVENLERMVMPDVA